MKNKIFIKILYSLIPVSIVFGSASFASIPKKIKDQNITFNDVIDEEEALLGEGNNIVLEEDGVNLCNSRNAISPLKADEALPSSYFSREDYVFYSQNQHTSGFCWVYSAVAAIVNEMERATGEYNDFSEEWEGMIRGANSSYVYSSGGSPTTVFTDFKKYGALYESDLIGESATAGGTYLTKDIFNFYSGRTNKLAMQNISTSHYVHNATNRNSIKQAIIEHGATTACMMWNDTVLLTFESGYEAYTKVPNSKTGGHAVAIVGWDDNLVLKYNDVTYTGAWIVQNNYGERRLDQYGTEFVMYDDPDIYGYCDYCTYDDSGVENASGIRYSSIITESSAETIINNNAGILHGDHVRKSVETKQKNVFRNKDVSLTYSYKISPSTSIEDVEVYSRNDNVTNLFDFEIDKEGKTLKVSAKNASNIDYGFYKIRIKLVRDGKCDYYYNSFYVVTGAETGTVRVSRYNGESYDKRLRQAFTNSETDPDLINSCGEYHIINGYNYDDSQKIIRLGVKNSTGSFTIQYYINMFDDVSSISVNGIVSTDVPHTANNFTFSYFDLDNVGDSFDYTIRLASASGAAFKFVISVIRCASDVNYYHDFILLNLKCGSINQSLRELTPEGDKLILSTPVKEGYVFKGWFYDAEFTQPVECVDGVYYYDAMQHGLYKFPVTKSDSYCYDRRGGVYAYSRYNLAYASWWATGEKEKVSIIGPNEVTKGFSASFTINHEIQNVDVVIDYFAIFVDDVLKFEITTESFSLLYRDVATHIIKVVMHLKYYDDINSVESEPFELKVVDPPIPKPTLRVFSTNCTLIGVKNSYDIKENVEIRFTPDEGYQDIPNVVLYDEVGNELLTVFNQQTSIISFQIFGNSTLLVEAVKIEELPVIEDEEKEEPTITDDSEEQPAQEPIPEDQTEDNKEELNDKNEIPYAMIIGIVVGVVTISAIAIIYLAYRKEINEVIKKFIC